jgi:hypothetical protein
MHASEYFGCCGLRIVAGYNPSLFSSQLSSLDQIRKDLDRTIRSLACVSGKSHNSVTSVLNEKQNTAYASVMAEYGFELLRVFPNYNENKQPLYLYFKEGGLMTDLPPLKVKDEKTPPKSPASRV